MRFLPLLLLFLTILAMFAYNALADYRDKNPRFTDL